MEENDDTYTLKTKLKFKKLGKDHILKPAEFFNGLKEIYLLLNNGQEPDQDVTQENLSDIADDMVMASVWHGAYFDQYDYDSFDYHDGGNYAWEDDGGSIFDS